MVIDSLVLGAIGTMVMVKENGMWGWECNVELWWRGRSGAWMAPKS